MNDSVSGLTTNAYAALTISAPVLPIAHLSKTAVEFTGTVAEAAYAVQEAMCDRYDTHGGRDRVYTGLRSVRNKLDKLNAAAVRALPIGAMVWNTTTVATGVGQPRHKRELGIIAPDDFPAVYNHEPVSGRPAEHLVAVRWQAKNTWSEYADWVEPNAVAPVAD